MNSFLTSLAIIALYSISLFGWGKTLNRFAGADKNQTSIALNIALGISIIIVIGGVLNALSIAHTLTLDILVFAGLLPTLYFAAESKKQPSNNKNQTVKDALKPINIFYILLISIFVFLGSTLIPSAAFNFHDDFHTYIPRIFQMLQAGSLGNNPFALIGLDSLGAQSFMQAFAASRFPVTSINAWDSVFCFALSIWLLIAFAKKLNAHWIVTLSSLTAALLINAQQVNISSVYSSVALIIALAMSTFNYFDQRSEAPDNTPNAIRSFLPICFLLSALIALKFLSAIFASLYFIAIHITIIGNAPNKTRTMRDTLICGATLTLLTLPWFLTHSANYLTALSATADSSDTTSKIDIAKNLANIPYSNFFNARELFWGGSLLAYNTIFLSLVFGCILGAYKLFRHNLNPPWIILFALCLASSLSYVTGMLAFEYQMALRYSIPAFIASLPVILILFGRARIGNSHDTFMPTLIASCLVLGLSIYSFTPSLLARMDSATRDHSILRFPINNKYKRYMRTTLSDKYQQDIRELQTLTEEGSGILTWTSAPFLFDFQRNKIFPLASPAVLSPWFDLPLKASSEDIRQYLRLKDVKYIIWEFKGFGMTPVKTYTDYKNSSDALYEKFGTRVLELRQSLETLAKQSEILYFHNGIIVFKI